MMLGPETIDKNNWEVLTVYLQAPTDPNDRVAQLERLGWKYPTLAPFGYTIKLTMYRKKEGVA